MSMLSFKITVVLFVNKVSQLLIVIILVTFITLIISALVVLFTSTSPSDAPLNLLLFPLLLLRLGWLLLMVRRLKITNII